MPARILVAYASKKGSTAGIAKTVGRELQSAGHVAIVAEMRSVLSLEGYDGVVLGAPVYTGSVMADLTGFVARHREALSRLPVAAFTAGIAPVYPKTGEITTFTDQLVTVLQPKVPVSVTMFAGALDRQKLSFIERGLTALLKVPTGDFRDWDAIAAWSRELPGKMGLG
ncbi:MAG: flavodoxin [Methanomicrobiales archaeon]|mgnify:CR=1 FL=1|nr:flavodoxin [Methanomicrobiales archaeon]